jgi:N-acetylmuramoyl-L-alanine amidase
MPAARANADQTPDVWFAGTRLIFDHPELRGADVAVATSDAGLARLLARTGATLSYENGQRYIVITAADRRTITLTVGDTRVSAGGVTTAAPFAPYTEGNNAFVPLATVARALYLLPVMDGGALVLEPQFGALDVRSADRTTIVTLHGALPLAYRRTQATAANLSLAFNGLGSSLDQSRAVAAAGLGQIDVLTSGSRRNPTTTVTFETPPGAQRVLLPSSSPNDLTLAFAPAGVALRGSDIPAQASAPPVVVGAQPALPSGAPPPPPLPVSSDATSAPPPAAAAVVGAVDLAPRNDGGADVRIAVSGNADYEWHRLKDGRWYVDVRGATLGMAPRDDTPGQGGVDGLRVHQFALDPVPIVRISLSLASQRRVDIATSDPGIVVSVAPEDDAAPQRLGVGRLGEGAVGYAPQNSEPVSGATPWKFGSGEPQLPAATNPRLIVLDPGHGGSDTGAAHNGLVEKTLTLDIANRLRSRLIQRGWIVRMTRDTDTDVYAPNDSARDELQARCDIANKAGARMFVSVHVNSFTSSGLNGTTTYYYKPVDLAMAQAVQRRLIASLGTKDDGVRKDNFYVIHHTAMPAILIETAFLSNPDDAALLHSTAFLDKVAAAIADGIGDYAHTPPAAQAGDAAN